MDTRAAETVGPRNTPLGAAETHTIAVRGTNGGCTIPLDAVGLGLNVTAINASSNSYLTVFPGGTSLPLASNLNWVAGQPPTPNAVTVAIGATGTVSFYNNGGTVDLAADIVGYYIDHSHDDRYYTKAQVDATIAGINAVTLPITAAQILDGTIASADIANGSITGVDIAAGTVTGANIAPATITGANIAHTNSIVSDQVAPLDGDLDIIDNSITTFDIATDAIDSDEVLDFGLSNEDVGVLFAQINSDGTVFNSSGGVTAFSLGTGSYEVDFGRDISSCGFVVTQGEGGIGGAGGAITGATDRSGNAEAAFVTTRSTTGTLVSTAFQMIVVC